MVIVKMQTPMIMQTLRQTLQPSQEEIRALFAQGEDMVYDFLYA